MVVQVFIASGISAIEGKVTGSALCFGFLVGLFRPFPLHSSILEPYFHLQSGEKKCWNLIFAEVVDGASEVAAIFRLFAP
jgi:hypothetical protein